MVHRSVVRVGRVWVAAMVIAVLLGAPLAADDWPQWRGPQRDGSVPGASWPADFSGLEQRWTVPLGPSYSGPIVAGDRVFVTETHDKQNEIVRALDRRDGREIWRATWSGSMKVPFFASRSGSWVRATPAYDGQRLYVPGMREVLVALDAATGREVWRVDFPKRYGTKMGSFGFVCSPLVDGDHLYIEAANSVLKIDAATGETIWRTETSKGGMSDGGTFSSPVLAEIAGTRQLIVQTRQALKGVNPEDGAILWSQDVPAFRGMNILTPTVHGDAIFTSTYRNASYLYRVARQAGESASPSFTVQKAWESPAKAYMSSPVLIGDHVYLHQGNGRLTSLSMNTGADAWTSTPVGEYWSLTWQGDRILALSNEGELFLVAATPETFSLIDQHALDPDSETWGHLAVSGSDLYVRAQDSLLALRWNEPTEATPNGGR